MKNKAQTARKGSPGASLPTVIMVVALMMTLAFTVVAIAFTHLNLSFRSNNNAKAQHLAEAVLALAIEKAYQDQENYGVTGTAEANTIQLSFDSYPAGNLGVLSFDKDTASSLGVPYSTSNRSENSVAGSNPSQGVPGQSLHLVARAQVGGAYSTMETIVEIPKFPYSVASGGAIRSNGGLLVASLRPGSGYDLSLPINEEDLQPGHLVSNSQVGSSAVVMEGENRIMGDLQSASGATLDDETQVRGEVRLNADKVELPKLHASDYDPLGAAEGAQAAVDPADVQTINSGAATLEVKGYNVFGEQLANGSYNPNAQLTVDNEIKLNGGVLYVNGNLKVNSGGVSGKGAIIATGNIEITGGGEASSDNQAALIADGNIVLEGSSTNKAKFGGLIYTNGALDATNMRLAGVFVAGGDDSAVTLEDTELYQVTEYANIEIGAANFELPDPVVPSHDFQSIPLPAAYDFAAIENNLTSYLNPNTAPGQPKYLFKFKTGSSYMTTTYDPATGDPIYTPTTGPDQYLLNGPAMGLKINGVPITSLSQAETEALDFYRVDMGLTLTSTDETSIKNKARQLYDSMNMARDFSIQSGIYTYENGGNTTTGANTSGVMWALDLSEIFQEKPRMQVLYWGEY